MISSPRVHYAHQHRTNKAGVEAVSITSNRQFPRHAHDTYGLGLLEKGAHRTWSSFGEVESTAGDVICVNPEEMHDGIPIGNTSRSWRMMFFSRELIAGIADEDSHRPLEFARPVFRDTAFRAQLQVGFARLIAETVEPLAVEEALVGLVMTIRARHSAEAPPASGVAPAVRRARQMIDDAPSAAISLEALAAASNVSRFQLIRGFAREVGVTPYAYQLQRRVRLARRFIAERRPLAEAAGLAGFADQSHMTRAFVRQYGVTPSRYQRAFKVQPRTGRNILQDD